MLRMDLIFNILLSWLTLYSLEFLAHQQCKYEHVCVCVCVLTILTERKCKELMKSFAVQPVVEHILCNVYVTSKNCSRLHSFFIRTKHLLAPFIAFPHLGDDHLFSLSKTLICCLLNNQVTVTLTSILINA